MRRPPPWGPPPSSYKRSPPPSLSLTPPREGSLSPSRIYPPWSRTSEIHVPGGFRQERVVLPLHRWSEEAEVARCLERVCEHGCAAVLRRSDFLSILRSARDRLHQPRVELVKLCRSSRVYSLRIYIRPLFISSRYILVHSSHRRKIFVFYAANPIVVSEPDLCVDDLHG